MAVAPLYLADKSALARLHHPAVARRLGPLLVDGLVATTPINGLAVLHDDADYDRVAEATGGKSTQVLRHDAGPSEQETA